MSAEVVSLDAARRQRALPRRDRLSAQAEVRCGLVVMLERDREVAMTPAAARTFARGIITLADTAEGRPPEPCDAEARARLALLANQVDRFDRGEARVSDLMVLLRQVTAEARR